MAVFSGRWPCAFFLCASAFALAGCADAPQTVEANPSMWGPCRALALQRQSDERLAGYDEDTLGAALAKTYDDCVAAETRGRAMSVYGEQRPEGTKRSGESF